MGIPADFHSTGINVGNYQLKIIFDIFGHKRIPADLHSTGMYVGNYQLKIIFDIFGHKRIPADLHSTGINVGNYQLKIIFDILVIRETRSPATTGFTYFPITATI